MTQQPNYAAPLLAVGMISASALAYEILLTRLFALVHWHHLVATVISLALLGYGASGSFLTIFRERLRKHFAPAFVFNALLFSLSAILCTQLAQAIPFDPQALSKDKQQLLMLALTFLILALPLFAAANCIGLALASFRQLIPRVYGVDLISAGLGAIALTAALAVLHPIHVLLAITLSGTLAAIIAAWRLRWYPRVTSAGALVLLSATWLIVRPGIEPAPYKELARSLDVVGAELVHQQSGIGGTVSVVVNQQVPFRYAPGLSLQSTATPPSQRAVFVDGNFNGTLLDGGGDNKVFLNDLLSALPYRLLDRPKVAVLNSGAGFGVHQALGMGAKHVTAVESDPQLHEIVCKDFGAISDSICNPLKVQWRKQTPRGFMASEPERFDIIKLDVAVDIAGLDALNVDFDLSLEAVEAYLRHLSPHGMLVIQGDSRLPPRISMRLLNTVHMALVARSDMNPAAQVIMLRGWQHFLLLVGNSAFSERSIALTRRFADDGGFDLIWLPDIAPDEANRFQQLNTPLYYQTAARILREPATSLSDYAPVTDDRPFPYRFSTWSEIYHTLANKDSDRSQQIDEALIVAAATLMLAVVFSAVLILLPLFATSVKRVTHTAGFLRLRVFGYFGLTGLAFLFIELGLIQRLQLFLDQPLYATVMVVASFLLFAGLGSLWAQQAAVSREHLVLRWAVAIILAIGIGYILLLPSLLEELADWPLLARLLIVLLLVAPLALAMGVPFSLGLRYFGAISNGSISWAWGINGCASVISAAGAPLFALQWGFSGLVLTAVVAYMALPLLLPMADTKDASG